MLQRDEKVQRVELYNYLTQPVIALVFDLILQLDQHSQDPSELQARTVSELPLDILALLFPELLKYQADDIRMVFDYAPETLEQAAARYDIGFQSKLFQEPNIPAQQLLKGIISNEPIHETLLKKINIIISEGKSREFCLGFLVSFTQKKYSQALRRLCTLENTITLELLEHLLNFISV